MTISCQCRGKKSRGWHCCTVSIAIAALMTFPRGYHLWLSSLRDATPSTFLLRATVALPIVPKRRGTKFRLTTYLIVHRRSEWIRRCLQFLSLSLSSGQLKNWNSQMIMFWNNLSAKREEDTLRGGPTKGQIPILCQGATPSFGKMKPPPRFFCYCVGTIRATTT